MSEKDRLVTHWMNRFKENWPRLDAGKRDQIERFLYEQKENIVDAIGRKIHSQYTFPPVYADLVKVVESLTVSRVQEATTQSWTSRPRPSEEDCRRKSWMAGNIEAALRTKTIEEWSEIMHQMAEQCQRWGGEYSQLAESYAKQIIRERERREESRKKREARDGPTRRVERKGYVPYGGLGDE